MTLDDVKVGDAVVVAVPTHVDGTVLRLLEMGLTAGTHVVVTRRALGGDPLELSVRGTRLCLRRAEARRFPVSAASVDDDGGRTAAARGRR